MKLAYVLFLLLALCEFTGSAQIRSNKKKTGKAHFKLVESYYQHTIPGIREAPVISTANFVIAWESKKYPEAFFWRGAGGWLSCKIMKAHHIVPTNMRGMPRGLDYATEFVTNEKIRKGDTLLLTPVTSGKFPTPSEIPDTARNDLFYKTGGSGWLKFHIDSITKKHDLVMP